jgi:hypothetical protein
MAMTRSTNFHELHLRLTAPGRLPTRWRRNRGRVGSTQFVAVGAEGDQGHTV